MLQRSRRLLDRLGHGPLVRHQLFRTPRQGFVRMVIGAVTGQEILLCLSIGASTE